MIVKIRAILDDKKDVFRDVIIHTDNTLEQLHQLLQRAFDFKSQEMAVYYTCDSQWRQKEEIPMMLMDENHQRSFETVYVKDIFKNKADRLIYVYDLLSLWTFFLEAISFESDLTQHPQVVYAYGVLPLAAPDKKFQTDESLNEDLQSIFSDLQQGDSFLNNDLLTDDFHQETDIDQNTDF